MKNYQFKMKFEQHACLHFTKFIHHKNVCNHASESTIIIIKNSF